MSEFISNNIGTLIVGLILLCVVAIIVARFVRIKKKGGHPGCECGCDGCNSDSDCKTQ